MKSFLITVILHFALLIPVYSQKAPAKFGDVSMEELKMTTYDPDTSAAAVILVDYGQSSLEYNQEKGFRVVFERLRRIKILRKEGLGYADYSIQTYRSGDNDEKISALKAVTYNLVDGKISETKMKSESVFKEVVDKNHDLTKFTLPNVKEGSVIEYSYRLSSDFVFNYKGWQFQYDIPVVLTEYRASFPEWFHYDKYTQGYVIFDVNEHKTTAGSIILRIRQDRSGDLRGGNAAASTEKLDFQEHRYRWVAKNVPAFKAEPFITTEKDYLSRINFELAFTQFPQQPMKRYMGTWEDINKFYADNSDFLGEVTGNGHLKKLTEDLTAGLATPEEKIVAIHSHVKRTVEWNRVSTDFTSSNLKKVLDGRKGNSAEINLLLASMLDKAGFVVEPVLISTRDHGFIREHIPVSTQFNHVLVLVAFGDKRMLLDATEPLLPADILPERCLNGKGFVISKAGGRWIDIKSPVKTRAVHQLALKLLADGQLEGNMSMEYTGYKALNERKKLLVRGEEEYVKQLLAGREWEISKQNFENLKDIGQSLKENFELQINNHTTTAGDVIYINPIVIGQMTSNPFKLEKREYPVDFGFPSDEVYVLKFEIPDGYDIDEMPQSKIMMLPQNASRYVYSVSRLGNTISVTSSFSINKSLFTQMEYSDLREYFNQVVAKQSEQIVLKKKI